MVSTRFGMCKSSLLFSACEDDLKELYNLVSPYRPILIFNFMSNQALHRQFIILPNFLPGRLEGREALVWGKG